MDGGAAARIRCHGFAQQISKPVGFNVGEVVPEDASLGGAGSAFEDARRGRVHVEDAPLAIDREAGIPDRLEDRLPLGREFLGASLSLVSFVAMSTWGLGVGCPPPFRYPEIPDL